MSPGAGMPRIVVYSTRHCGGCARAKALLASRGLEFEEILVDADPEARRRMESLSGRRSVPQVFVGPRHVGGFDALRALDASGALDALAAGDPGPPS